jgi:hypothetical protein
LGESIPIDLNPSRAVEVDGALVARGRGREGAEFRQLMEQR